MHELSIALSIVEGAEEEALRQGGERVTAVYLRLGPLSGVVREALTFSFDLATEGTRLAGARLIIDDVLVRIYCETCRAEGDPVAEHCLHCARCGGSACKVVSGDELELAALELEDATAAVG
jgi:hydrogenase nickel incorporation protein HypA/HybF